MVKKQNLKLRWFTQARVAAGYQKRYVQEIETIETNMNLADNTTFQIVFVGCLIVALLTCFLTLFLLKKKGVNINSSKVQLTVGLLVLPIVFLPGWFHPQLSLSFKIILTVVSNAVAICNFLAVDRGGKIIRQYLHTK